MIDPLNVFKDAVDRLFQGAMTALNGSNDIPCFDMTSHSQLTIANSRASCLPPMDEGSFKYLQRCSWRAVPGLWKQILHWFFHFPNQLTMSKHGSNENPLMSQLYFCMLLAGQTSQYLSVCLMLWPFQLIKSSFWGLLPIFSWMKLVSHWYFGKRWKKWQKILFPCHFLYPKLAQVDSKKRGGAY